MRGGPVGRAEQDAWSGMRGQERVGCAEDRWDAGRAEQDARSGMRGQERVGRAEQERVGCGDG